MNRSQTAPFTGSSIDCPISGSFCFDMTGCLCRLSMISSSFCFAFGIRSLQSRSAAQACATLSIDQAIFAGSS